MENEKIVFYNNNKQVEKMCIVLSEMAGEKHEKTKSC